VADLIRELVWSHSRARAFEGCRRAYWFAYYGSWGGWKASAPPEVRDAWVQKKLTSRSMWIGSVVHAVAEHALKRLRDGPGPVDVEDAVAGAVRGARRDVADSASGAWLQRPAQLVGFREHYYGEPVDEAAWEAAIAEIERQVRALWTARTFRRLHAVPERILELEELRRFAVGDVDVYVSLDVMVDDGRGGAVILDWKTGENHDHDDIAAQLGVYGLYATSERGLAPDRLVAMHVNVRHGTETLHPVGAAEIASARERIQTSTAAMRALLSDVAANEAERDAYPPLPVGDPACPRCGFRGICGRRS
jgi:hypothetical protein